MGMGDDQRRADEILRIKNLTQTMGDERLNFYPTPTGDLPKTTPKQKATSTKKTGGTKSYSEAYAASKSAQKKYGSEEAFTKAAKAWNVKKYGTTEPTSKASKKGVTKSTLAKEHTTETKANERMGTTISNATNPSHKLLDKTSVGKHTYTFGQEKIVKDGIVNSSVIRSSTQEIKPPKHKSDLDKYTEANPDKDVHGGSFFAGTKGRKTKAYFGAGYTESGATRKGGMKDTLYNLEDEKLGTVKRGKKGFKIKKTRTGRQEERARNKERIESGHIKSKKQQRSDKRFKKRTGIDLSA